MKKIKGVEKTNVVPLKRSNPLVSKGYESIMTDWLARFSSRHTVRVYRTAVKEFFGWISDNQNETEVLSQFLWLDATQAMELVCQYEGWLVKLGNAPATINRKLASIKSLVNYASSVGKCYYTLSNLKSKSVTIYRDTSGISTETFKTMLATVNRSTLKGKRDYAILLLLWGNALRRSEVTSCLVKHFEPLEKRLWILGKGKKGQLQSVTLGDATIQAIFHWLEARYDEELRINNEELSMKPEEFGVKHEELGVMNEELGVNHKELGMKHKESLGSDNLESKSSYLREREDNLKTLPSILHSKFYILNSNQPLFCAVHKGYWGHQLNTDSIYKLVKKYANLAGIQKSLSPHRLRHSAITAALEATNGDVRSVQKLSRHSSLNTLMIYDDNRRNEQGRVTNILESLL